jgi:hypothetical protein
MYYGLEDADLMSIITEIYNCFGISCPPEIREFQNSHELMAIHK